MQRPLILILCFLLFSGCAGFQLQQKSEWSGNFTEIATLGVKIVELNNEVVVSSFYNNSPAALIGINRGDVITSVNSKNISTRNDFISIIADQLPGARVSVVVNRNGQIIKFDVETGANRAMQTSAKIISLLNKNKKVSLAVIISEVKNSYPNVPSDWTDSMRNTIQVLYEESYLSDFGDHVNFSIVDRNRLKEILGEMKFYQTGLVSDKLRIKIGEMTGATHILDATLSRFQAKRGPNDELNSRLIEIESGAVLAVDRLRLAAK